MSTKITKNPKFRVLCKRCNSYLHTRVTLGGRYDADHDGMEMYIECTKCGNSAEWFDEEEVVAQ